MKKSRKITVRVTPELYRQTGHLAASYDSTVTQVVELLLKQAPRAFAMTNYGRVLAQGRAASRASSTEGMTLPPRISKGRKLLLYRCSPVISLRFRGFQPAARKVYTRCTAVHRS